MSTIRQFRIGFALAAAAAVLMTYAAMVAGSDAGEPADPRDTRRARSDASGSIPDPVINRVNEQFRTVEPILRASCYDCHSAYTEYPWYHRLPVISGMIDDHIKEGREHLDFTDGFPFAGDADQVPLLQKMRKEIDRGDMPPLSYWLMHWGAKIDGAERDSVFAWIDRTVLFLEQSRGQ